MGKSRLVAEALDQAAMAGMVRMEGQCSVDASVPYAPFVTAWRRRTRRLSDEEIRGLFAGRAALAANLLPELADVVPTPPARSPEDLYAAVWHLLSNIVAKQGGLLVLEDLHWADPDSLKLLTYLARETEDLPLWIVGTYRSDEMHRRHPLQEVLTELNRERRYDEVSLTALDTDSVRGMLSAIFNGTEISDEFAAAVQERTDGNPFFVEELTKVMMERGDVYLVDGEWERRSLDEIEMPQTVRDTLLARVRTMSDESVRMLQLAALAGVDLDFDVLTAATGLADAPIEAAIQQGLASQILTERRDVSGTRYAFRHALSREALADELVGPDRSRAHLALARAIESVYKNDLDRVAAELVEQYAAAGEDETALEYALRAGRTARAASSHGEADYRYNQAITWLKNDDERRLEVCQEASGGGDWVYTFDSALQLSFAEEARRLAITLRRPLEEAKALTVIAGIKWDRGLGAEGVELLAHAHQLINGADDYLDAFVLARETRLEALADNLLSDDPRLLRGLEIAEATGNYIALSNLRGSQMLIESSEETFSLRYQEAVDAALIANDPIREGNAHINCGYVSLWRGMWQQAAGALQAGAEVFERIAPAENYALAGKTWLASLSGRYVEAQAIASQNKGTSYLPSKVVFLTALAEVALQCDESSASDVVDELMATSTRMGEAQRAVPGMSAHARFVLATRGVDEALPLFWAVMQESGAHNRQAAHWPFSTHLARALADQGRITELERWLQATEALSERDPNHLNAVALTQVRAYHLATLGRDAEAVRLFADAARLNAELPRPANEIECWLGMARSQTRLGDRDDAIASLDRAASIARECGANTLAMDSANARNLANARPVLATLLFTDMVGSSEDAANLGDTAWRERLERHHGIVRRELARRNGREIDTAGDGFLAAFDSPADAVRCAGSIHEALREVNIPIRAGIHTGECQELDGKLTGLTVHIAARVSSKATAGEVLVSSTVRELMVGSQVEFEERGTHELKGIPGEWRLFAVRSV
jgi:class 3 adenylate cyclase